MFIFSKSDETAGSAGGFVIYEVSSFAKLSLIRFNCLFSI